MMTRALPGYILKESPKKNASRLYVSGTINSHELIDIIIHDGVPV